MANVPGAAGVQAQRARSDEAAARAVPPRPADPVAESLRTQPPPRPADPVADSLRAPAPPPRPQDPVADSVRTPLPTVTPTDVQIARGSAPFKAPPTRVELDRDVAEAAQEIRLMSRRAGRPEDADREAEAFVSSVMHQRAQGDRTHQVEPTVAVTNAMSAAGRAVGSATLQRAGEAFGPHDFGPDQMGARGEPGWRVAATDAERRTAASIRAANDIRFGIPADRAKADAEERYSSGKPLLLPTPSNTGMASVQATITPDDVTLPTSRWQRAADVDIGAARAVTGLVNKGLEGAKDPTFMMATAAARAVGAPDAITERLQATADWHFPDPAKALADWLADNESPAAQSVVRHIAETDARGGGIGTGFLSAINATTGANFDPTAPTITGALTKLLVPPAPRPGPAPTIGDRVASVYEAEKAGATGAVAFMNPTLPADERVAGFADAAQIPLAPINEAFDWVTHGPDMRENLLGSWMRVGGTAIRGAVTTYAARVADRALMSMGATSFRNHRVPGEEKVGWAATLFPILDPGNFTQDYLTTVYNGDSLTSEAMRTLDTMSQGLPDLSPEWRVRLQSGGSVNKIVTAAASVGDLLLPLDEMVTHPTYAAGHAGLRFYDGFDKGRTLGMTGGEAATLGASWAAPRMVDPVLRGRPEYDAARVKSAEVRDADLQKLRADAVVRGDTKQVADIDKAIAIRDTDAPTVAGAVIGSWARRSRAAGKDPVAALRMGNMKQRALADRYAEVLTLLHPGRIEGGRQEPLPTGPMDGETRHPGDPTMAARAAARERVATAEGEEPVGEVTGAHDDPRTRAGQHLREIADKLGASDAEALAALRAAASFNDPATGRTVRQEWPNAEALEHVSDETLKVAVDRLRTATPAQIWRNVRAFERGEKYGWRDDVAHPNRARVRDELFAHADQVDTTLEPADIQAILTMGDHLAQVAVDKGFRTTADEYWAGQAYRGMEEAGVGADILAQDRPLPIGAKELRERLETTHFITNARLMEILGDQRPEYLDAVASFILEQRAKVRDGLLTNRDVAKAYIMSTASQGSGAMDARAVEQVLGSALPPEFTVTSKRGQRLVRPEEAMAAWLFSPMGQRALDAVERGVFDAEAWQSAARVRKAFGDDRINNLNVLGEPKKGAANMRNIGEVTAALNAAGGDWKKVEAAVSKLNGVAVGKSPFIGHLLGFGEMPTLDAREINGWLLGRADTGGLDTARANLARTFSDGLDSPPLARAFMAKIQDRFLALQKKGIPGTDLAPEVFGAIMHHWLWDKLGGTKTTHEGLYKAMRLAQDEAPKSMVRKGEIDFTHFVRDGQAIIRLAKDADLSTLAHEQAHYLRRILPREHMAALDEHVTKTFGGWTREAEEWFARNFEAILRTGKLSLTDAVPKGIRARLTDALRYAAQVFQRLYTDGVLPEVHPVFAKWMEEFAGLKLPDVKAAKEKAPPLPKRSTVPAPREGWSPSLLAELEAAAEAMRAEADPKARNRLVQKWLSKAHETLVDEKEAKSKRHKQASGRGLEIIAEMLDTGRREVAAMSPEARVAADEARLPPILAVAARAPVDAPVVVPEVPAAPPGEASAPVAAAPAPDHTANLRARVSAMITGSENATVTSTVGRARSVIMDAHAARMAAEGQPLAKSDLGAAITAFGPANVNDYLSAVRKAYKDYPAGKAAMDPPRMAAVQRATDDFLARVLPREPAPPRPTAIPSTMPEVLHDIKAPVAEFVPPKAAPPGVADVPVVAGHGTPWLNSRGAPRVQVDGKGRLYNVVARLVSRHDVSPSHTRSMSAWTEDYPQAFQNRTDAFSRIGWKEDKARAGKFVPVLAVDPNQITPTMGALVFWSDAEKGKRWVASGNGRYFIQDLILENAHLPEYAAQAAALRAEVQSHATALGLGSAGPDDIIALELLDADFRTAVEFAQNSQDTPTVNLDELASVVSLATQYRGSGAGIEIDARLLPPEITEDTALQVIALAPASFDAAFKKVIPDVNERIKIENGEDPNLTLQHVQAVFLAMVDENTQRQVLRHGKDALYRLIACAPALVHLERATASLDALHPVRASDYFRDAIELWQTAKQAGKTGADRMGQFAVVTANQAPFAGADPLPVSRLSLSLALLLQQKATPGGVAGALAKMVDAAEDLRTPPTMFRAAPDPMVVALDILTAGTKNGDIVRKANLPDDHMAANVNARMLGTDAAAGVLARKDALSPVVTEPPGWDAISGLRPPDVLAQHRGYSSAVRNAAAAGEQVRTTEVQKDRGPALRTAGPKSDQPANPSGTTLANLRAKPLLTREEMNLALGYRGDQRIYDAADLESRALAWSAVSLLQGQELPSRYERVGARVAVPVRRVAAVRARAMAAMGDLPEQVRNGLWTITDTRDATGAVVSTATVKGVFEPAPDTREVVRLSDTAAHRVLFLRDMMNDSGWAQSLPLSVQRLTFDDLTRGSHGGTGTDFTTQHWRDFTGAVADMQSGTAPWRGRAEKFNLAANLVWWASQRRTDFDALPPGASASAKVAYKVRSALSAAILSVSSQTMSGAQFMMDVPEHIRPVIEQMVREIGRSGGDFVEAIEGAIQAGTTSDTMFLDALRGVAMGSQHMEGLDAPISVRERVPGQGSTLNRLRGWLFQDPVPNAAGHVGAPWKRPPGDFVQHDLPRGLDYPHPITVAEIRAHLPLIEEALTEPIRTRGGMVDGDTTDLLVRARTGLLSDDECRMLLGHVWSQVDAAQKLGEDILTSAAGQSGNAGKVRDALVAGGKKGVALDAYEAFYTGQFNISTAVVADHSVETMLRQLGNFTPVKTELWVAETLVRLKNKAIIERTWDRLIDLHYVQSLTDIYRSTHPGQPVPDIAHRAMFAHDVARAATAIMLGADTRGIGGTTSTGVEVPGYGNYTGMTEESRGAAHTMIANMGLRADLAYIRKGLKGTVVPNRVVASFGQALHDERGVRRSSADIDRAFSTLASFASADDPVTLTGRNVYLSSPLMERCRELLREQSPIGEQLAAVLADRDRARNFGVATKEYLGQYKGQLITGGPNAYTGTALALATAAGGGGIAPVALAGMFGLVASFRPRLAGYANQTFGGLLQGYTEMGLRNLARSFSPRVQSLAALSTRHSVHFQRMAWPFELAMRATRLLQDKTAGAIDRTPIIDPWGRVWSLQDHVAFCEKNGLDGTQAKFESAEQTQAAINRMARQYAPKTPLGKMWDAVLTFYGRNAVAENYRKVYEAIDTQARYAIYYRGILDGLHPQDALKRSLNATFDYSVTSPLDRGANSFFLFWMFQRRAVDMTIRALILNPHRVLGPLAFLRAQQLQSGYANTDKDHNVVGETESDFMAGRAAIAYLPVSGVSQAAMKVMMQEPVPVSALKVLSDFANLDIAALAGRANPIAQLGLNELYTSMGGDYVSWYRKQTVVGDSAFNVPFWLIRMDQEILGGSLTREFGVYPYQDDNPTSAATVGNPWVWRVPDQNHLKWDAFRVMAPGMTTLMQAGDLDDRSGGFTEDVLNGFAEFVKTLDPGNAAGTSVNGMDVVANGGVFTPAPDATPRPNVGLAWEMARNLGLAIAPVSEPYAVQAAAIKGADAAAKAKLAELKKDVAPVQAPSKPVPNPGVNTGKGVGLEGNVKNPGLGGG